MSTNYNKQTIGSGFASQSQLQDAEDETERSFNDTLSKTGSGSGSNALETDLDLNSNDILNAGSINGQSITVQGIQMTGATGVDADSGYNWTGQHTFTTPPTVNGEEVVTVTSLASQPIVITTQTGITYTTVLADAGSLVQLNNANPISVTIPPNSDVAYPIGTALSFAQIGAGTPTFLEGVGVTINTEVGYRIASQYGFATFLKTDTDTWLATGSLIA